MEVADMMKALWLMIALCLSGVVALTMVEAQRPRPLTLTQIEQLLDNQTPDVVIAREVNSRGLDFTPNAEVVEKLRRRGAGVQTIQAVSALLPKSTLRPPTLETKNPLLALQSSATEEAKRIFLTHFTECNGNYRIKVKTPFRDPGPYEAAYAPSEYVLEFTGLVGFDFQESSFTAPRLDKLQGADKLNNRDVEWEASFTIKSKAVRGYGPTKEKESKFSEKYGKEVIEMDKASIRWGQWSDTIGYDRSMLMYIKLYKKEHGWESVEVTTREKQSYYSRWVGKVTDTYEKASCKETGNQ
jgi:hypothetical protein